MHRRIPRDLLATYRGSRCEVVRSLRTSDPALARTRLHAEVASIEANFARRRARIAQLSGRPVRHAIDRLSPELLDNLAAGWLRSMLHADEMVREGGLSEAEFEDLGKQPSATRSGVAALLAPPQSR